MNKYAGLLLRGLRQRVYPKFFDQFQLPELDYINDRQEAGSLIKETLEKNAPCMIARYGSNEMSAIVNYIGTQNQQRSVCEYIKGKQVEWWWRDVVIKHMQSNAGFFPSTPQTLEEYARLCIEDSKQVDVLGSWLKEEFYLEKYHPNCKKVRLRYLEPDFTSLQPDKEWTSALAGKRVLVVHPFEETINNQYKLRKKLFLSENLIPEFELITLKAVQSIGGASVFKSWFDALDYMKSKMDQIDYDICIIGCGAYGFNLAAHAKRTGHKAIHLGGATQLLFGIIGKRWEDRDYYKDIINQYWCRPQNNEKPNSANKVEGGCYW